jgi:putative intracellular protease/amidase
VAIPWKILSKGGIEVVFTTPDGQQGAADRLMLTGEKLGILKPLLMARSDAVDAHEAMLKNESFGKPLEYAAALESDFDALYLPGGHDKGVKEYLESELIQMLVVDFFKAGKPVAAICHGVVVAARSNDPKTGKSVIHDFTTTALLKSQELAAYNLTRLWMGDYYLTYPGTTVEDEVKSTMSDDKNFVRGPTPVLRDNMRHLDRGFVVKDRNYLSARWPGDVYSLSLELLKMMEPVSVLPH